MKNSLGQPKQKTDPDVCLWAEEQEKYRKLKRKPNKKTARVRRNSFAKFQTTNIKADR